MAPRKINDMDAAALLWKLHQKRQITLDSANVRWLEMLLGPERLRFEVSRDAELAADAATKEFAATTLLLAAMSESEGVPPVTGLDLGVVQGLYCIVRDAQTRQYAAAASFPSGAGGSRAGASASASTSTKRKREQ